MNAMMKSIADRPDLLTAKGPQLAAMSRWTTERFDELVAGEGPPGSEAVWLEVTAVQLDLTAVVHVHALYERPVLPHVRVETANDGRVTHWETLLSGYKAARRSHRYRLGVFDSATLIEEVVIAPRPPRIQREHHYAAMIARLAELAGVREGEEYEEASRAILEYMVRSARWMVEKRERRDVKAATGSLTP